MEALSTIWNEVLLRPMANGLLILAVLFFHNFGVGVIAFTVLMRVLTYPLTVRQSRATKAMAVLQPKLQEVQKKYAKDRQKVSQETMKLYKEHGISPLGCLGPMLIQFPIWIALYYGLVKALPSNPESLVALSSVLYSWATWVQDAIPLNSQFLWLDLTKPDPTPIMPVLVGASMFVLQKMSTFPSADPRQKQTNQIMQWMMPLLFMMFTFSFPSGLALYWFVSNAVGIAVQYSVSGWGGLATYWQRKPVPEPAPVPALAPAAAKPAEELSRDGAANRGQRQDGRGSDRPSPKTARRKTGRGGS
ncbi:MAG: membrane protein insertase YidC [Dehalococcoidia bacterium]|nr:membrane protein insertase YidC [Dehalococcoidia bacterium]